MWSLRRSWWLLARSPEEVEICVKDLGFETNVVIEADLRAFTEAILGRRTLPAALREGPVKLHGPAVLALVAALAAVAGRGDARHGPGA